MALCFIYFYAGEASTFTTDVSASRAEDKIKNSIFTNKKDYVFSS